MTTSWHLVVNLSIIAMFTTPTTSTNQIQKGANAIGAIVGEDWFSGRLGMEGGVQNIYGDTLGLH